MGWEKSGSYGPERRIGTGVKAGWGAERPGDVAYCMWLEDGSTDEPSYMLAARGSRN